MLLIALTFLLIALVLAISAYDISEQRIPNSCNLALLISGAAATLVRSPDIAALRLLALSIVLAFLSGWCIRLIYYFARGRQGLGMGDVKFVAAAAAWTGIGGIPSMILIASACALAFIGVKSALGKAVASDDRLPFGPFLGAGVFAVWCLGPIDLMFAL